MERRATHEGFPGRILPEDQQKVDDAGLERLHIHHPGDVSLLV